MSAATHHCSECGESMPPYSRLCPYCLYASGFDDECRCHIDPMPYLDIMKGYVDEALLLPSPDVFGRRDEVVERELEVSYQVVEGVVECAFGGNSDVRQAVAQMSDLLYTTLEERRKRTHRRRVICGGVFVSIIILIFSLSVLIC